MMLLLLFLCLSTVSAQYGSRHAHFDYGSACIPNPCKGPNTQCIEGRTPGVARCECLPGYLPDPNTIDGCRRAGECRSDGDCSAHGRSLCIREKCVRPCDNYRCGRHAYCEIRNRRPECVCWEGYVGTPYTGCRPRYQENKIARSLNLQSRSDPCSPNPCGTNARCTAQGERPVCECPPGYTGNPLTRCKRGECEANAECAPDKECKNNNCVDPCLRACGLNAKCYVQLHVAVCSCPSGFTGQPKHQCKEIHRDPCDPNPCGKNALCRANGDRAQCRCPENYIGNALTECRPECERDSDCPSAKACINLKCRDPCIGVCGENADCKVRNHKPVCSCPEPYIGSPYTRCYPECTQHSDCPRHQACFGSKCADPCKDACGVNANCEVTNHKAICSCPKGYTGHPFTECKPFEKKDLCIPNPCGTNADCNPGHDRTGNDRPVCTCPAGYFGNPLINCQEGECRSHSDCASHRACLNYHCEDPCLRNPCAVGADCSVNDHIAVCTCPRGMEGDATVQCTPTRSARRFYK